MTNTQIRTNEDAINWLAANEPETVIEDGHITTDNTCWKCSGTGQYAWFGVCFRCEGRGFKGAARIVKTPVKKYAQAAKAKARAAAKRAEARKAKREAQLEKQRDWCEANGFGRITFDEKNEKQRAEREARFEAQKQISQHVGTVKERREFTATIKHVATWETAYGWTYCYIMRDEDQNVLIWKASNAMNIDETQCGVDYDFGKGYTVKLKATIKEHGERKGEKQTIITRGTLLAVMVDESPRMAKAA